MRSLKKLEEWINGLGADWNLFGDIDKGKYWIDQAKEEMYGSYKYYTEWNNFDKEIPQGDWYDLYWVMTKSEYGYDVNIATFERGQFTYTNLSPAINVISWQKVLRPCPPAKV